ncbi:MAG TPA: thioredoxin domain-containing protein [Allosphingosinicella sp.]|jgi:protein-disulfide isomerase
MKALIGTGALALALLLTGCGDNGGGNASGNSAAPAAAVAPPANGDWTQTVVETPEGGFRMGNPNAQVKLVEYASLTCPHCGEFSEEASEPLTNMVKTGQVSWEFRHYMLFPTDPGMSLLSRCQGPGPFFALTEQIYADQKNWVGKVQALPQDQLQQLQSLPPEQQVTAIVKSAGLDQFFRQRGMPQAKIDQCLADQQGLQKLAGLTNLGNQEGVTGTPTFFINGKIIELANSAIWPQLEPKLRAAMGQ